MCLCVLGRKKGRTGELSSCDPITQGAWDSFFPFLPFFLETAWECVLLHKRRLFGGDEFVTPALSYMRDLKAGVGEGLGGLVFGKTDPAAELSSGPGGGG